MYESPIEVIYQNIQYSLEEGIFKALQDFDIKIDRDELIKALQYDRNQYQKGYYDGLNHRGEGKYIKLDDLIPVLAAWICSDDDFQAVLDAVNQLDVTLL